MDVLTIRMNYSQQQANAQTDLKCIPGEVLCGFSTSILDVKHAVSIKIALSTGVYVMSGFDPAS